MVFKLLIKITRNCCHENKSVYFIALLWCSTVFKVQEKVDCIKFEMIYK